MMDSIITIISVVVSITAVVVSVICNNRAIKSARASSERQNRFNLFVEYTRRYQEIILNLYSKPEKRLEYTRLYFDLCGEEFYLHNEGMIDDFIWNLWVDGMRTMMNCQQNETAWRGGLASNFDDEQFKHFMEHDVIKKAKERQ